MKNPIGIYLFAFFYFLCLQPTKAQAQNFNEPNPSPSDTYFSSFNVYTFEDNKAVDCAHTAFISGGINGPVSDTSSAVSGYLSVASPSAIVILYLDNIAIDSAVATGTSWGPISVNTNTNNRLYSNGVLSIGIRESGQQEVLCSGTALTIICTAAQPIITPANSIIVTNQNVTYTISNAVINTQYKIVDSATGQALGDSAVAAANGVLTLHTTALSAIGNYKIAIKCSKIIPKRVEPSYVMSQAAANITDFWRDGNKVAQIGNNLYTYGGWNSDPPHPLINNEQYKSSGDLSVWTRIKDAEWSGRHVFGFAKKGNELFAFLGDAYNAARDCWKTTDGENWTLLADNLNNIVYDGQGRTSYGACEHKGYLYIVGGTGYLAPGGVPYNNVMRSADGITWTEFSSGHTFMQGKNYSGALASFNGNLYLVAGGVWSVNYNNEMYRSSDDGLTWTKLPDAPFGRRQYHDLQVWDNKLWMIGGDQEGVGNSREIWWMDTSEVWHQYTNVPADYEGRHATGLAVYNNGTEDMLVIVCGNTQRNDCWIIKRDTTIATNAVSICNAPAASASITVTTILPLRITNFKAKEKANNILLQWAVEGNTDNNRVEIERSADGKSFIKIGEVEHNGVSQNDYAFTDANPLSGINFYQLKMVEKNGKYTNSQIIAISKGESSIINTVAPNPFQNNLSVTVTLPQSESLTLSLLNENGLQVFQKEMSGNKGINQLSINALQGLTRGMYLLRIKTKNEIILQQKLIKNDKAF